MKEIQFRYRLQKDTDAVVIKYLGLEDIERGYLSKYYKDYRILSRDLFTGHKDKNNRKIYEVDIAIVEGFEGYTVKYLLDDSRFVFESKSGNIHLSVGLFKNDAEIIDNTHDNSRLIK